MSPRTMSERSIPKKQAKKGDRYAIFFGKHIQTKRSDVSENQITSDLFVCRTWQKVTLHQTHSQSLDEARDDGNWLEPTAFQTESSSLVCIYRWFLAKKQGHSSARMAPGRHHVQFNMLLWLF